MAVVFGWDEGEMQHLVKACESDEGTPIIQRHFKPGEHLLEAGCGSGRWVRYFQDRGYRVTGLEINDKAVAMTKRVWPDLNVICGDCESSPFPDNYFDGVLSFGVVEHWTEGPQKPLADIYRILKPGAKAFISVPCQNTVRRIRRALWLDELFQAPRSLASRLIKGKKKPLNRLSPHKHFVVNPPWGPFFEYRMTSSQFRAEIEKSGLKIIEHTPIGHIDGIYHDMNVLNMMVGWKRELWTLYPTPPARAMDKWLRKYPFAHAHMQAIIAQKPG